MTDAFNANVARVAAATVSGEILAAGWFHVYAGEGAPVGGGVLGLIATAVDWVRRKQAWRWPVHAYWAVTPTEVWVLDLKIGAGVELGALVGRWKRNAVNVANGSAPHRVSVQVPGKPPVESEAAVVRMLRENTSSTA